MSNTDRWKPALNGFYYYISGAGEVSFSCWYDDYTDRKRYNMGNCFATAEEAKEVADAWRLFLKNRLVNDYHESKNLKWNSSNTSEMTKLPDWCKQNEWIFDYNELEYAQVKDVFGDIEAVALIYAGTKERVTKSWKYIIDCCYQAKVRPYCDQEMKQLIGKILDNGTRKVMVTACEPAYVLTGLHERVFMAEDWYTAEDLIKYRYTLDGKPCGKLVHKKWDAWIE